MSISAVINALNAEDDIKRAINSVKWADEIVVVDDGSTDKTLEILSRLKAEVSNLKLYHHKSVGYVEPARNFAINKATSDWILIIDTDEEIPGNLAEKLNKISSGFKEIDYVEIPRRNIIFGKWMQASMWWPDYNIRFFRKDSVIWKDKIHSEPETKGVGIKLDAEEKYAIIHHHYSGIGQFLERLNRYTTVQANELSSEGTKFKWQDLLSKPLSEFLSRFFANKGFSDGLHGLALSFLQAFSFLIVYLKLWELQKFTDQKVELNDIKLLVKQSGNEIDYWFKYGNLSNNPLKRFAQKVKNKF